ncbi:MAG: hypothetical protein HQM16_06075 [Deltaproteobacteria bacterium]|nr:hypothetical protein [Deltaproteobacteria bacterium]
MNLDTRQKAFFLFTVRLRTKQADQLLKWLPQKESAEMLARFKELKEHDEETIKSVAVSELRRLAKPKSLNYLSEVHDDWIVSFLKKESPEMIATVLRYLPAERVDAILQAFPPEILDRLPQIADAYSVPQVLVDLLKQRFENLFVVNKDYHSSNDFEFEHFCLLNVEQMAQVFLEIGYYEIALALKTVPRQARDKVMARLLQRDKQRVALYLDSDQGVSVQRIKKAQIHLLSRDIGTDNPADFIEGLGFLVFARAVLPKDLDDFDIIMRKMPLKKARLLQTSINEHIQQNSEASVLLFREDVLKAAKVVLTKKRHSV